MHKARTLVGRGEKGLLRDPGSELRLAIGREKRSATTIKWGKKKKKNYSY